MKTVSIKQNTGLGARWRSLARRLCLSIRAGALARIVDGYLIRASVAGERGKAERIDRLDGMRKPLGGRGRLRHMHHSSGGREVDVEAAPRPLKQGIPASALPVDELARTSGPIAG